MNATNLSRKNLVERYIKAAWVLKIRLMSARRQLWGQEISLIHLENSSLQLRKSCESIAFLCVIAAEIEFEEVTKHRKNYRVGEVFSALRKSSTLKFPSFARLSAIGEIGSNTRWQLRVEETNEEDIERVKKIHDKIGNIMHEFSPYLNFPRAEATGWLWSDFNAIRADHQWLWNRFWHHSIQLSGGLFFVDLGDQSDTTRPTIIKMEGFVDEELSLDFDPDYVADFSGKISWADYDDDGGNASDASYQD